MNAAGRARARPGGRLMAVQDTAIAECPAPRRDGAARTPAPKPARRLPVQQDWPLWAIIATQIGILVGIIAFWEIGARSGFIDGFFWSQPSAIARTFVIFFTEGDAWTDISFTFRSTILGFIIGTTTGSLFGLSFWWSRNYAAIAQPYIICFESMPKLALAPLIILVFGLGLISKVVIAIALTFVISTLTAYAGVKALDPDGEKLFYSLGATRWQVFRKLVDAVLPAVDHLGAAGQHRPRADRRHRRRVHLVAAWPRPRHLLRRLDLRHRARLGRRFRALGARHHHVRRGVVDRERVAQRHTSVIQQEARMDRRKFLGTTAAAGAALVAKPYIARAAKHELLVAEPVHSTGYLPMYIAMAKDYFAEADINVKIVTIETGAGHTNAVLSGQAFAFIGGPEHCAFAKAKGAELRAVVHCVDRGNVYFCAAKGLQPEGRDFTSFVKGKALATGGFGGTPNSITRYLLKKWNLDAKNDVTLVETANSAILAAVRGKQAQLGCSTEPFITQGVKQSIWSEPFFNVPKELGPYAYSTINIRLELDQEGAGGGQGLRARHDEGPEVSLRRQGRLGRNRQEAIPDHAARRSQGDARPLVRRRDVEQGRHDQPAGLGHRQGRGDGSRYSQNGRQV